MTDFDFSHIYQVNKSYVIKENNVQNFPTKLSTSQLVIKLYFNEISVFYL